MSHNSDPYNQNPYQGPNNPNPYQNPQPPQQQNPYSQSGQQEPLAPTEPGAPYQGGSSDNYGGLGNTTLPNSSYPPPPPSYAGGSQSNAGYPNGQQGGYYPNTPNNGMYNYNMPPQQPQKKKRTWLWVTLSLVAVFVIIIVVACTASFKYMADLGHNIEASATALSNQTTTTDAATATTTATSTTSASTTGNSNGTDNGGTIALGQTHTYQGVSCTVKSAKVVPGDDVAQPSTGHEFVEVDIVITNNSSKSTDYNEFYFYATSEGEANIQESYVYPDTGDPTLDSNTLPPGRSVEGNIFLEIHTGDQNATLQWKTPDMEFDSQAPVYVWKLSVQQ